MRAQPKVSKKEHERKSGNMNLYFHQNEKLQVKNLDLKHRLCLLEFGLGLIATIFEEHGAQTGAQAESSGGETVVNERSGETAMESIGKVLYDMERTYKSVALQNRKKIKSELVTQVTPLQTLELSSDAVSVKPTIFIDEMESGKNSFSGLCSIQVVENSNSGPLSDPRIEALSTLASVASGDYN